MVNRQQSRKGLRVKVQAIRIQVILGRQLANRGVLGFGIALAAPDHPIQDPHVFTESGPHEVSGFVLAEPVDMKDGRRIFDLITNGKPVAEIVGEVVSAKRLHRHRITAHDADLTGRRSRCF